MSGRKFSGTSLVLAFHATPFFQPFFSVCCKLSFDVDLSVLCWGLKNSRNLFEKIRDQRNRVSRFPLHDVISRAGVRLGDHNMVRLRVDDFCCRYHFSQYPIPYLRKRNWLSKVTPKCHPIYSTLPVVNFFFNPEFMHKWSLPCSISEPILHAPVGGGAWILPIFSIINKDSHWLERCWKLLVFRTMLLFSFHYSSIQHP